MYINESLNEYGRPLHACHGYRHDAHYWALIDHLNWQRKQPMHQTEELKAKIVISGVLVFKDKDGEIVKEIPFQTVTEDSQDDDQRSQ